MVLNGLKRRRSEHLHLQEILQKQTENKLSQELAVTGGGCSAKYLHFRELPFFPNSLLACAGLREGEMKGRGCREGWNAGNPWAEGSSQDGAHTPSLVSYSPGSR